MPLKNQGKGGWYSKKNPQQQQSTCRFLLSAVRATLRVDEMEAILHGFSGEGGGMGSPKTSNRCRICLLHQ